MEGGSHFIFIHVDAVCDAFVQFTVISGVLVANHGA